MELTKAKKIQMFHVLLGKVNAMKNKQDILSAYGVSSTLDLTDQQLDDVLDRVRTSANNRYTDDPLVRFWRSNVIKMVNKYGIDTNNGWESFNAFMLDSRICGRLLYELDVEEMKVLCRKLHSIVLKKEVAEVASMKLSISLN